MGLRTDFVCSYGFQIVYALCMMTSIAGGLNTGIWLCAVVLGAAGSAIIVTVAASLLCAGVKCIVKHFKNGG